MKQGIFLIAAAILLFQCGSGDDFRRDATTVGTDGWVFEGWACAPQTSEMKRGRSPADYCTDSRNNDYLYMKFAAVASDRAIRSGRLAQMQSTCRRAARDQVSLDGLSKIVGDYLDGTSGVVDGQSTGQAIIAQTRGRITGIGIYDCCALDNDTGRCVEAGEREDWEQCLCVGYMRFPGGQRAFESMAEEVSMQ